MCRCDMVAVVKKIGAVLKGIAPMLYFLESNITTQLQRART